MNPMPPLLSTDKGPCSLALVWDGDLNAIAVSKRGTSIQVGPAFNLSSHDLLAIAASMSLMTAVLALARDAGITIQGYVSSARLCDADGRLAIALAPCVVVHRSAERTQLEPLWRLAVEHSPVLRLFGDALEIEPSVRAASAA